MLFQGDTWRYFGEEIKGVVLDNAYDEYSRRAYKKYMSEEKIRYACAQDTDMREIAVFENIEFLKIPPEAEYLDALSALKRLKGIWVCSNELKKIDLSWFPLLEKLVVAERSYIQTRKALKSQGKKYAFKRRRSNKECGYEYPYERRYFIKRKF